MRLFTLIDFRHLVLALFLGCGAAVVIYLAFHYGPYREQREGKDEEKPWPVHPDYLQGSGTGANPLPPVLLVLYLAFIVWLIVYVILIGIFGGPV